MELHYKTTVWVAMKFPEDVTKEEIIERLEKGEMPLDIGNEFDCEYENMTETEEYVTLEENDGQSTIEVMEETEKGWLETIWDNSYESEVERKLKNK
jgi:hypothetical protein